MLLAGDHIYKMDYELMLRQHVEQRADVTVGCLEMPRSDSSGFGIMHVDGHGVIQSFLEKPIDPPPMPGICSLISRCHRDARAPSALTDQPLVDEVPVELPPAVPLAPALPKRLIQPMRCQHAPSL